MGIPPVTIPPPLPAPPNYEVNRCHEGYNYENRPPNKHDNRHESYYQPKGFDRLYSENESDYYYYEDSSYKDQGQLDHYRYDRDCDRYRYKDIDRDLEYERRPHYHRYPGDRFEECDYDFEARKHSRECSTESFCGSGLDYDRFRQSDRNRNVSRSHHSREHSLERSSPDYHHDKDPDKKPSTKPCTTKDKSSLEKLEEKTIETPVPEHDHFLKSTSVGILELSEMEVSKVVKFIKKMR